MSPLALIVIYTNLDLLFPWTHCQCRKCTWNHLSGLTAVNIPVSRTACNQVACTQCQEPTVPVVTGVAVHFYGPLPQLDISGLCVCVTYATIQTSQSSRHPHTYIWNTSHTPQFWISYPNLPTLLYGLPAKSCDRMTAWLCCLWSHDLTVYCGVAKKSNCRLYLCAATRTPWPHPLQSHDHGRAKTHHHVLMVRPCSEGLPRSMFSPEV